VRLPSASAISDTGPRVRSTGPVHGISHFPSPAIRRTVVATPSHEAGPERKDSQMDTDTDTDDSLVVAVEQIVAARGRVSQPSDGGGSGKSDLNDG
jgi:hypothetical protein